MPMNKAQQREWTNLWQGIAELSSEFGERPIFIGGVAVWLHLAAKSLAEKLGEFSHDGDLLLSLGDFADLRDLYEVEPNRRLGKNQIRKHGIEFDVYVERNYDLVVPYADAMAESVVIQNVRVVSIEHLFVLKLEASIDRRGSEKGAKDERDLIRLCHLMNEGGFKTALITPYLRDDSFDLLRKLEKSSQFLSLAQRNAHEAKPLRVAVGAVVTPLLKGYRVAM